MKKQGAGERREGEETRTRVRKGEMTMKTLANKERRQGKDVKGKKR